MMKSGEFPISAIQSMYILIVDIKQLENTQSLVFDNT